MAYLFADRRDAGRKLALRLVDLRDDHPVVLGLPRGGIPVAFEVAQALDAPLDVLIVRKLGVPAQPELGMGAIGEGGTRVLNRDVLGAARITADELAAVERRERLEVDRRVRRYRGGRPMISLEHRTVIIVDDGLATGSTARAAAQVARTLGAARVILAAPVAPPDTVRSLHADTDDMVVLFTPPAFRSLGEWYADFGQTPDEEVVELLAQAGARTRRGSHDETRVGDETHLVDREVTVDASGVHLAGHLSVPANARGVVAFAHGSGSSRHSPRNIAVARILNNFGLGTLLFDLLAHPEASDRANVFDVGLLARRLHAATSWLRAQPGCRALPIGYFGASTGAAAALIAAAEPTADVAAVVSRGGRPDLAGSRLAGVRAPTLLIVGSLDHAVIELNRQAERQLRCEHRLAIVEGATHLLEEPGTLAAAADLAATWFVDHFALAARARVPGSGLAGSRPATG